jgi:hypothetical protein
VRILKFARPNLDKKTNKMIPYLSRSFLASFSNQPVMIVRTCWL